MSTYWTNWSDQWIEENYPNALFFVQSATGEIGVMLGLDEEGNDCT
jgi:hypothetical protein